jgi:large subunit ribosomal protein L22
MKSAVAYTKGLPQAPRKVAIVASLVRDRNVEDARVILQNTPRRSALPILKAIDSAVANLLNTGSFDSKTLAITRIVVSAGPRMRRYMPSSRGRALPFEKKSSNILVEVRGEERAKKTEKVAKAEKPAGKETK